jgi:hypothetical protein
MDLQARLVDYSLVLPASDGFRIYTDFPPFSPTFIFEGRFHAGIYIQISGTVPQSGKQCDLR